MSMLCGITTVLGDIPPEALGVTLIHEHLLCDLTCYFEPPCEKTWKETAYEKVDIMNLHILRRWFRRRVGQ